jgi:hypothetical protein
MRMGCRRLRLRWILGCEGGRFVVFGWVRTHVNGLGVLEVLGW